MRRSIPESIDELYLLSRHYLKTKNQPYTRELIERNYFKNRLTVLIGQRGTGKTTLIIQYLLQQADNNILSNDILYVPSDHFLIGNLSLYEIAESFVHLGGKTIAFDEIHKYHEWSKELKSIYDTFPKLKVIASGSSALKISQGSHDLSRRSLVYKIYGLSFREYLRLGHKIILTKHSLDEIIQDHEKIAADILRSLKEKRILPLFKKYLQSGYYPYFLELADEDSYFQTLEQNFHTIIESDLPAIYPNLTGNSIRKIKHLLAYISTSVPFIPNIKKLKTIIDTGDERTLKTYLKYLEDAGLIRTVMSASNKMKRIETPEKIYLDNPNQFYAFSSNIKDVNIGTVREIFILNMLANDHEVTVAKNGDFTVDGNMIFEVGGRNKKFEQIKNEDNAFLALDDIEIGISRKIPLWLFGFLY